MFATFGNTVKEPSKAVYRMIDYIILPDVDVSMLKLVPQHEAWLKNWLLDIEIEISNDSVSSAWCLQGTFG